MRQVLFLLIALCTLNGCGSSKTATQLVRDVSIDTVYLSNVRYDSIYIFHDRTEEFHPQPSPIPHHESSNLNRRIIALDTLFIKDKSIEYRYKLIRDTVKVIQRDSIPYQVTITEVKEIPRSLGCFDHLTRTIFWILASYLFLKLLFKRIYG